MQVPREKNILNELYGKEKKREKEKRIMRSDPSFVTEMDFCALTLSKIQSKVNEKNSIAHASFS